MRFVASTSDAASGPLTLRPSLRLSMATLSVSGWSIRIRWATATLQTAHQGVRPSQMQSGFRTVTASYPQEVKTRQFVFLLH